MMRDLRTGRLYRVGVAIAALALRAVVVSAQGDSCEGTVVSTAPATLTARGEAALVAYVKATALNVRADAGVKNPLVGILLKFDPVLITDHKRVGSETWYKIEAAGGYVDGWVSGAYLAAGASPVGRAGEVDYGPPETPTLVRGNFKYVGVAGCQGCHSKPTGKFPKPAYAVWAHQVHADAFGILSLRYTKAISKRLRNIEDPEKNWRCLKCHVTAYGADPSQLASSYKDADGVGCEVCHGPGGEYARKKHGPSNPEREKMGFVKLANLADREHLCVKCHNPVSPTYKPFNVLAFSRDILHWVDPNDEAYVAYSKEAGARVGEEGLRGEQPPPAATTPPPSPPTTAPAAAGAPTKKKEKVPKGTAPSEAEGGQPATTPAPEAPAPDLSTPPPEVVKAVQKKKEEATKAERRADEIGSRQVKSAAAKGGGGLDAMLASLPASMTLNRDGEKKGEVSFKHAAHASEEYVKGITCKTCHHTQKANEKPAKCMTCHRVGGDADEDEPKTKATHSKEAEFGKKKVSCVGCHMSMNAELQEGKRTGNEAPTKCTTCHANKEA